MATVAINNFAKWEQAFRVFSNIYCKFNPHRSSELIEYNHVIHTIALAYTWENMYMYDREFRLHMARNPHRSWAMKLQQAWSLRLHDRIGVNQQTRFQPTTPTSGNRAKIGEPCRRFNRGRCHYGSNCKFEHRCLFCWKFGHPAVKCRRAKMEQREHSDKGAKKDHVNFKTKL